VVQLMVFAALATVPTAAPPLGVEKKLEKQVTVKGPNLAVTEVLQELATECDVTFAILDEEFRKAGDPNFKDKKVTVDGKPAPAREVLAAVLKQTGATYKAVEDYIHISPAKRK
jgi:hypothetical protein